MSDYFSRHAIPLEQLSEEIREETNENSKLLYSLTVCPYTSAIPKELLIKETNKDGVLRRLWHAIYLGYCPNDDDQLKPYRKIGASTPDAPWNNVSVDLFGPMPR